MILVRVIYLLRRHLEYYNLINTINLYYTKGILLYISILLQLITGLYITIIYYYIFYIRTFNYHEPTVTCQKIFIMGDTINDYYITNNDYMTNKYLMTNRTYNEYMVNRFNNKDNYEYNNDNWIRDEYKYYNRTIREIELQYTNYDIIDEYDDRNFRKNIKMPNGNNINKNIVIKNIDKYIEKNNIIKRIDNKYIINEIYIGIIIRYIHSYNPTLIIIIIYLHIIRSLYYNNWKYNSSLYVTG